MPAINLAFIIICAIGGAVVTWLLWSAISGIGGLRLRLRKPIAPQVKMPPKVGQPPAAQDNEASDIGKQLDWIKSALKLLGTAQADQIEARTNADSQLLDEVRAVVSAADPTILARLTAIEERLAALGGQLTDQDGTVPIPVEVESRLQRLEDFLMDEEEPEAGKAAGAY